MKYILPNGIINPSGKLFCERFSWASKSIIMSFCIKYFIFQSTVPEQSRNTVTTRRILHFALCIPVHDHFLNLTTKDLNTV